jgi:hypothetical protein
MIRVDGWVYSQHVLANLHTSQTKGRFFKGGWSSHGPWDRSSKEGHVGQLWVASVLCVRILMKTKQGRLTHYGCICVFHILHRRNLRWGSVDLGRIERTRLVLFVGDPKKSDSLRSPQMSLIEHVRKINELHEKKQESTNQSYPFA